MPYQLGDGAEDAREDMPCERASCQALPAPFPRLDGRYTEPMDGTRRTDCAIRFEGETLDAVAGEPVAVALIAAGRQVLSRSIKYHRPRSGFCLAGHCGACLGRVDGVPNVKLCRTPAREGLVVERQNAFPSGDLDVLAAADWLFARGMDHHTLATSPRPLNALLGKVVRRLGGLGRLPDEEAAERVRAECDATRRDRPRDEEVDVLVVGGGPAGLRAAAACAEALGGRRRVVLLDEGDQPGGSLWAQPDGPPLIDELVTDARSRGVELHAQAAALGWYPEDDGGLLAATLDTRPDGSGALVRFHAARFVYATGGYDVNALFPDNDRPGIYAARAVGRLLVRHRLVPGRHVAVLDAGLDDGYGEALERALAAAGALVERVKLGEEQVVRVHGRNHVRSLELLREKELRRLACDAVAVAERPAPASELLRQHGAEVRFAGGGFAAVVDEAGRTGVEHVHACGDVCGHRGVMAALAEGERVGRAVAATLA